MNRLASAALALTLCAAASAARAETVADFYKGRTVTVIVGFSPGGGYDFYGRLVGQFLGRHIPGNPQVVVQNKPGAGSVVAASSLYNTTQKDGTQLGIFLSHLAIAGALQKSQRYEFDKFTWVGRLATAQNLAIVWPNAPATTVEAAKSAEVTLAASGPESATTRVPIAFNRLFGTKFKPIIGYDSSAKMALAMERGETHGVGGISLQALQQLRPQWLADKAIRFLWVTAMERHSRMPDIPAVPEFGRDDEERRVLRFIMSPSDVGIALASEPSIPADRAQALRAAFDAMVADKEFQQQAEARGLELDPISGVALTKMIEETAQTPAAIVDKARELLKAN